MRKRANSTYNNILHRISDKKVPNLTQFTERKVQINKQHQIVDIQKIILKLASSYKHRYLFAYVKVLLLMKGSERALL